MVRARIEARRLADALRQGHHAAAIEQQHDRQLEGVDDVQHPGG